MIVKIGENIMKSTTFIKKTDNSFWKRYYYSYIDSFLRFLVPTDANYFSINQEEVIKNKKFSIQNQSNLDYIIASDVVGYLEDVQFFLENAKESIDKDGRVIITQYNTLWEPFLNLASFLGLRRIVDNQNWVSLNDLKNFANLSGMDIVKSGTKMIMPVYIPIISNLLNRFASNIPLLSRLGIFHYIVLRKGEKKYFEIKPSLSIIVPARNEAGTIEKIVKELPELGSFTEIIFIEGNSTDNTFDEIKRVSDLYKDKKKIKFAKQKGKGKGDAVRLGFEMAVGDIVTIYDADMTVPAIDIKKFYNTIIENRADFINGSRLVYPMEKQSMRVLNFFGNKFFSLAFSFILDQRLKDTLCGTKMLWKKDYERIKKGRSFFGDFDPFGDFDLLFGAIKLNLKIIDLPIRYKERKYGETNISRWKHGWLLLRMVIFSAKKIKFI